MAGSVEASDGGRDTGAGCVGLDRGAAPRRERQPAVQMAARAGTRTVRCGGAKHHDAAGEYAQLQAQIDEVDAKLLAWHRADECSQRLTKIPGVGPIGAVLLKMKTPEPELFRSGRQFAAWIGLTPKDHSTAGKVRLGGITRAGDDGLRSVLVVGATTVIQHAQRGGRPSPCGCAC